jgi:hypothetical protein
MVFEYQVNMLRVVVRATVRQTRQETVNQSGSLGISLRDAGIVRLNKSLIFKP